MNLITFMQKIPTTQTALCVEYIKEGLRVMQTNTGENLKSGYIDIVADQQEYDFPTDMIAMRMVLINTDTVTDYYLYKAEVFGRKILLSKVDENGEYEAPNVSYTKGLQVVYTGEDTGFAAGSVTGDSDFTVRDEVVDALTEYVRMSFTPVENIKMRDRCERRFFSKSNDIEFTRSNSILTIPKDYLNSLRLIDNDNEI